MRPTFGKFGTPVLGADKELGETYKTIELVSKHLPELVYLAHNLSSIGTDYFDSVYVRQDSEMLAKVILDIGNAVTDFATFEPRIVVVEETANAAKQMAMNMVAIATDASERATTAANLAETADANASTALANSRDAKAVANGIDAKASSALTYATEAKTTADGVDAKATKAEEDAASALSQVTTVVTKAQEAIDAATAVSDAATGKVSKSGDTMTGPLNGTEAVFTTSVTAGAIDSSSAVYIKALSGASVGSGVFLFKPGSATDTQTALADTKTILGTGTVGTSTTLFSNVPLSFYLNGKQHVFGLDGSVTFGGALNGIGATFSATGRASVEIQTEKARATLLITESGESGIATFKNNGDYKSWVLRQHYEADGSAGVVDVGVDAKAVNVPVALIGTSAAFAHNIGVGTDPFGWNMPAMKVGDKGAVSGDENTTAITNGLSGTPYTGYGARLMSDGQQPVSFLVSKGAAGSFRWMIGDAGAAGQEAQMYDAMRLSRNGLDLFVNLSAQRGTFSDEVTLPKQSFIGAFASGVGNGPYSLFRESNDAGARAWVLQPDAEYNFRFWKQNNGQWEEVVKINSDGGMLLHGPLTGTSATFTGSGTFGGQLTAATPAANAAGIEVTTAAWVRTLQASDLKLKKDFVPVSSVLDRLGSIHAYTYTMKGLQERKLGSIAQDWQLSWPEAVENITYEGEDALGLNPLSLCAILTQGINEARDEYKAYEKRIADLEATQQLLLARIEALEQSR